MAEFSGKEIESFLNRVDHVDSLIKGLASGDTDLETKAAEDADKFLGKTERQSSSYGFDRSHINNYGNAQSDAISSKREDAGLRFDQDSVSPEDFMKRVEKDAAERRNKKEQNNTKANELKEKGNNAFKRKDYSDAVNYYTNAISYVKDNAVLYTNRAQAYIHLGKNDVALQDCLLAQKIDPKCVKAYIHQGRALQNLKRFDEAIQSFERVKMIDKKHTKLVQGYVKDAEKSRKTYEKEQKSISLEECGDEQSQILRSSVNRLRKERFSFYELCNMLRGLKKIVNDDVYRTSFRTCGGFNIIAENPNISSLFKSAKDYDSVEQDCVFSLLDLLSQVCIDNDKNISELLTPSMLQHLQKFISSNMKMKIRVAAACLVHAVSQLDEGRDFILQGGKHGRILDELLTLLPQSDEASMVAVGAINNLALCSRISEELATKISDKFTNFVITMMEALGEFTVRSELINSMLLMISKSLSTITNLAKDVKIRSTLARNERLWASSHALLSSSENSLDDPEKRDAIFSLLGLLMNISLADVSSDTEHTKKMNDICCRLITTKYPDIVERSAGLLSHLTTSCPELVHHNTKTKKYINFVTLLKGDNEPANKYIIKCIAHCSSHTSELASCLIQEKELAGLLGLLNSELETVVGNAALILGNCAKDHDFSQKLASTNVVQDLLRIATNDECGNTVKHNAAISIGKLATTDPRHLERLRELHGLEILHEVMKANKST